MKVKDKVFLYEIKLSFKDDEVTQTKEEYKVIGVNKDRLCIDNRYFTTIKHKKEYRGDKDTMFNEVHIIDWSNNDYFNSIYGQLYTSTSSEKIAYKRIKKALEKHINTRLSKYGNISILLDKIVI